MTQQDDTPALIKIFITWFAVGVSQRNVGGTNFKLPYYNV